ncbi:MAG TPA: response regulator [Flavobacterium sp.]|uniref:hybrid sensor histidine kinase/response regulator transcription factor n=2 Tax=Flavobacterium TaxID=237 RepID=UPI0025B99745|nr:MULTISPECIES: response regulator [unclassified Flavobacterium]HRE76673.1 response regulator [Flavobacterium sp.]
MKKAYLLLFFICSFSFAQSPQTIDSLKKVISSKIPSDDKLDAYHKLFFNYLNSNPELAKKYMNSLYKLSKEGKCEKCEIYADLENGDYHNSKNDYKKAIYYYDLCAEKCLKLKDYEVYEVAIMQKISTIINFNKHENVEADINQLLEIKKKYNLNSNYEYVYFLSGEYYTAKEYYQTALKYYIMCDEIMDKNKSIDFPFRININNMIALVYSNLGNHDKARKYIDVSLKFAEKTNDIHYKMYVYVNKGFTEYKAGNYKEAIKYSQEAYAHFEKNNMVFSLDELASNLGKCYLELKDDSKALYYFNRNIENYEPTQGKENYSTSLTGRAQIWLNRNEVEKAKADILVAKELNKIDMESTYYIQILDTEFNYFKKTNQLENAIQTLKTKDSLNAIKNSKTDLIKLNEVEAKYQNEKKEQQIQLLSTQKELAEKQKYIYIGLLGLLVILGASLFYGYRNKIKTAQKLNELNELKSRFFANISHEFRTPLTLIKSPVQSLQAEITNENQKNKLHLINKNSDRMLDLVDQLLELSKLDSGKLKLILKEGNIGLFLNSIIESFSFQAKENKLSFSSTIEKNTENHHFDKDVIEKIVTNLLSNAIKYTAENEKVNFTSSTENNQLKLVVSNSGSEIKKEEINKLFERFYQKKENHQGVGIGLALVKELVELYNGKIETTVENGLLSFTVLLPLEKSNQNAIVVTKETTQLLNDQNTNESELPILLLVDDNQDVRTILKDIFKENYQIIEAADGEQALKIAKKEIPDCIISDVMMPKMDGFEFTKQIKTNELTSFIPVILLTAKTSDEAHLEGLKSTADAFLTKPFNNEILKATVLQLIAERKKLHTRYSQELILRPVDIVINSVEEKFIEKLQLILNKELANSEFSSDDFAASIGMSRMQLHRKLKSLLGVSTSEFLRNERLKASTELLKKGKANISEIAYSVGFNDVSYFSKCFKEMYHCTPTEYMERN